LRRSEGETIDDQAPARYHICQASVSVQHVIHLKSFEQIESTFSNVGSILGPKVFQGKAKHSVSFSANDVILSSPGLIALGRIISREYLSTILSNGIWDYIFVVC